MSFINHGDILVKFQGQRGKATPSDQMRLGAILGALRKGRGREPFGGIIRYPAIELQKTPLVRVLSSFNLPY